MIEIKENRLIKTIENFDPKEWWLVCEGSQWTDESLHDFERGFWSLNRKIYRSYKGKEPDVAVASIMVEDREEFNKLRALKIDIIWT